MYAYENGISVKESIKPVSVEFLDYNSVVLENTNGYYNSYTDEFGNDQEYFFYHTPYFSSVKLTYSDGTERVVFDYEYEEVFGEHLSGASDQSENNQWKGGEEHEFYFVVLGCVAKLKLNILEEPEIENFSIRPIENCNQYLEQSNGEWMTEYSDDGEALTYWYYYIYLDNFYYSFTYNGIEYIDVRRDDLSRILGPVNVCYTEGTEQSYYNQWQLGYNTVSITLLGNTASTSILVVDAPEIENFRITPTSYYAQFVENTNGEWITEFNGYEDQTFWCYNIYLNSFYYSFTYNGEDYDEVSYYSLSEIFDNIDCYFPHETTQNLYNQWALGDNTVTVKLFNQTATAIIRVIETPEISNFSIRPTEERAQIVENTNGFWQT